MLLTGISPLTASATRVQFQIHALNGASALKANDGTS